MTFTKNIFLDTRQMITLLSTYTAFILKIKKTKRQR